MGQLRVSLSCRAKHDTNRPPKRAEEAAHENPTKRVRTVTDWPTLFTLATRDTSIFDERVVNVQDTGDMIKTMQIKYRGTRSTRGGVGTKNVSTERAGCRR